MNLGPTLHLVKSHLEQTNTQGLAIDIDDVLSQTTRSYHEVFEREFGPTQTTVEQARTHYAFHGGVLGWPREQTIKRTQELMRDPDFHYAIPLINRAQEAITHLHKKGKIACYHTARYETLTQATLQWLNNHNFPKYPLIIRPDDDRNGTEWKAHAYHHLFPHVTGCIDNDARIAKRLEQLNYQGEYHLFGLTEQQYQPTYGTKITTHENWDSLLTDIEK